VRVAGGWPVFWPRLAALTLYYGLYEYLHWCMHKPTGRRIERTRIFRYLDANHRLHHARWRFNFNVVCPLADIVLGTYRPQMFKQEAIVQTTR
jgi:sterol desaturase/sphingolipid hydroxylase (fatty acid hydroxylase superfamily)